MRRVTLDITESQYTFFMSLVKKFDFVKVAKTKKLSAGDVDFIEGLKSSFSEMEQHEKGKVKLASLDSLLNEL